MKDNSHPLCECSSADCYEALPISWDEYLQLRQRYQVERAFFVLAGHKSEDKLLADMGTYQLRWIPLTRCFWREGGKVNGPRCTEVFRPSHPSQACCWAHGIVWLTFKPEVKRALRAAAK